MQKHWTVVSDTTRVGQNFQKGGIGKPLVFNTVRT